MIIFYFILLAFSEKIKKYNNKSLINIKNYCCNIEELLKNKTFIIIG